MGKFTPFKSHKDPGIPSRLREMNPRSEIEAICLEAFRIMDRDHKDKLEVEDDPSWCTALDVTPVPTSESDIQVLVRMKIVYQEDHTPMYFYVIAAHIRKKAVFIEFSPNLM